MERYVDILVLSSGLTVLTRRDYRVLFLYFTRFLYCFNCGFSEFPANGRVSRLVGLTSRLTPAVRPLVYGLIDTSSGQKDHSAGSESAGVVA